MTHNGLDDHQRIILGNVRIQGSALYQTEVQIQKTRIVNHLPVEKNQPIFIFL